MRRGLPTGGVLTLLIAVGASAGLIGGDSAQAPGFRLQALFAAYWLDELRSDPLEATFNGDHRFDDRLADPSDAAHVARLQRDRATRKVTRRDRPRRPVAR